ncbi:ATP-binding protein [Streptomyces sp. 4R-3d]|uniref:ATP-binding protein n=1 Tax=Streptomyces sp. 4R-3d TaxID=2559605 RepID=UPI001FFE2C60|nr:ATP-binding protein [Streptomyces sp. 4R-3d]
MTPARTRAPRWRTRWSGPSTSRTRSTRYSGWPGNGPRPPPAPPAGPVGALLEQAETRWHGPLAQDGRRLDLVIDRAVSALTVPGRTSAQILDILLDNARRHGSGTVTVTLREIGDALAVDVGDEGRLTTAPSALFERGTTTRPGQGIGLSLAAELADSTGARLSLTRRAPTRFTLLLPESQESQESQERG